MQCLPLFLGQALQELIKDKIVPLIIIHVHQTRLLQEEMVGPCTDKMLSRIILQLDVLAEPEMTQ